MPRLQSIAVRTAARLLLLGTLVSSPAVAQTAIGDAVIQRTALDQFTGFILVSGHDVPVGLYGGQLLSVSAFGGSLLPGLQTGQSNVGREFVPLIVSMSAIGDASFSVVGVGSSRTVLDGMNTYDFGLTAGTDVLGAGMRFAWLNTGFGAFHYSVFDGDGIQFAFTDVNVAAPTVGGSYDVFASSPQDRAYSVQFNVGRGTGGPTTPGTPVPEPNAMVMLVAALGGLLVTRRAQRTA